MKIVDMVGKRSGLLRVIEYSHTDGRAMWKCLCDCGNETIASGKDIRSGNTKSCGCLKRKSGELNTTHGFQSVKKATQEQKRFYKLWGAIIRRCDSEKSQNYERYGGRGIGVCDEWLSFERFKDDMWPRPTPSHQIDRIDNSKGYCKENCRWVTAKENSRNRRGNRRVEYMGRSVTIAELAEQVGLSLCTLRARIMKLGWSVEEAVKTPLMKNGYERNGWKNVNG